MEEDWEKTLILVITLIIIGGFYISPRVKSINMTYYFALFIILFFICIIQTQYLKKWTDDKEKTDYTLVYWLYNLISIIIFLYLIYIIGQSPKMKTLKGGANMFDSNINISSDNSMVNAISNSATVNVTKNVLSKSVGGLISGVTAYTNFWKRLFYRVTGKNDTSGTNI
tara:strand:- start:43 stop:549 length:507 start_codon:yes stop_codon:yes gene_type:complete